MTYDDINRRGCTPPPKGTSEGVYAPPSKGTSERLYTPLYRHIGGGIRPPLQAHRRGDTPPSNSTSEGVYAPL